MKRIDFENGTVTENILSAALPMLAAQILSLLYNIVDRIYIGRIPNIGTTALGAVGLCFPLIMIITACSNLFGSGGAPLFSINRGKGDKEQANRILNTSFSMVCASALLLMGTGLLFAKPLLILFGASKNALTFARPYMMLYLLGTLPSMIATGMNPFINAQGYSTTGMFSVAIGAIANILLDPLFIFTFHLGVNGAAAATVLSQILSALFVFHFLRRKAEIKVRLLRKNELSSCIPLAKSIISLGTSGFIMQLTNSLVSICCNHVLSVTGGDVYVSVMTIISSVRQMVETPIYAITEGSSPIISYNYGIQQWKRVRQAFKLALLCAVVCGGLACVGTILFCPEVSSLFLGNHGNAYEIAISGIPYFSLGYVFFALNIVCIGYYQSIERFKPATLFTILRGIVIITLSFMYLPVVCGIKGIWLAVPLSELITFVIIVVYYLLKRTRA